MRRPAARLEPLLVAVLPTLGALLVFLSLRAPDAAWSRPLLVAAGGALALGLLAPLALGSVLQRDITALREGVARFARRDFSRPVEIRIRGDMRELGDALNAMAVDLHRTSIDREYVANLLDNIHGGLFVVRRDGTVERVNGEAVRMIGLPSGELVDAPLERFCPDAAEMLDDLHRGEAFRDRRSSYLASDKAPIPARIHGSPLRSRDGDVESFLIIVRDIRDLLRMEQREQELVAEAAAARVRAQKERLEKELEIAKQIQTGILPRRFAIDGLEIAARMVTAAEVGGDYYDVLPFDGGCWLAVGDVAGHGLTAGLVMLMVQSAIAALARSGGVLSPGKMLRVANALVFDNVHNRLDHGEHVTLSLLRYQRDGRIVMAGAHQDVLVCRAAGGPCEVFPARGAWLGLEEEIGAFLPETSFRLEEGDVMLLYSDGLTEAANVSGELFGLERVMRELEIGRDRTVEGIRDHLFDAVMRWTGGEVEDDISILAVRRVTPLRRRPTLK